MPQSHKLNHNAMQVSRFVFIMDKSSSSRSLIWFFPNLTVISWGRDASYSHRGGASFPSVYAAEESQGDQDDPNKDQDRSRHPQLPSLEALLFSHPDKNEGGPNRDESETNIQKYFDIAFFSPITNCLNII